MNWLLKIVEGPMKGAEIALVNGLRLKVGSAETCDIVLADSTIAAEAFELDVAPEAVTFIAPDGAASELVPFEVKSVGTSAFAVGPAEGDWKMLVRPTVAPAAAVPEEKAEEAAVAAPVAEDAAEQGEAAEAPRSKRRGVGCLAALVLLALLVGALWYFWPWIVEKVPQVESGRIVVVEKSRAAYGWAKAKVSAWTAKDDSAAVESVPELTLADIAAEHGLSLSTTDGVSTLAGNCTRRTERLAIRALAQAADPYVRFDLTDDETLRESANELLFALTGGSLKAVSATNRVVRLVGYAESTDDLSVAIRALNADVKNIVALETREVRLGLKSPAIPLVPSPAESVVDKAAPEIPPMPVKEAKPQKKFLVAGILMKPYPCVVMRNGLRLIEGAELGTARIERIAADRVVLRDGGATFEWKP